jgi:hypothetical protein
MPKLEVMVRECLLLEKIRLTQEKIYSVVLL